jgi:hypothetical protein
MQRNLPGVFTGCVFLLHIGFANATTGTRSSAFEYDATTGLLTKEIVEGEDSNLCLVTVR